MKEFKVSTISQNTYCFTVKSTSKGGIICDIKDNDGKLIKDVWVSNKNFVECVTTDNVYKIEFVEKPLNTIKYFLNVYTIQLSRNTPCQF